MATRTSAKPEPVDLAATAVSIFQPETVDGVYVDGEGKPLGLIARLAKIMGSLPDIEPGGKNQHFGYRFITDKQVSGLTRPRLAKQQILVVPETVEEREPVPMKTAKGGESLMTRITVTWRIVDGVTGESFTGQSVGYGDDSGDKGANKAFTAALKNFLIKLFEIGGDADIEDDVQTDKRAAAREAGSTQVEKAEIGEATVGEVERGGKARKATQAQTNRVGQYVRDLKLGVDDFAAIVAKKFGAPLSPGSVTWSDVKDYLEGMSGTDIGSLIAELSTLHDALQPEPEPEPDPLAYG